jgi:hypothetical protein
MNVHAYVVRVYFVRQNVLLLLQYHTVHWAKPKKFMQQSKQLKQVKKYPVVACRRLSSLVTHSSSVLHDIFNIHHFATGGC